MLVASPIGIPDQFELVLSVDKSRRQCGVVWRSADQIGVTFSHADRHPPPAETKAEEYRRKAIEAEETAKACRDHHAREMYLDIARQYRELAKQHERMLTGNEVA